uniref:Uncharacterized protein n=1 Tax=Anopheles atroparvus TaxID=41427 RepID=A0A182JJ28_ANOAO
MFWAALSLHTCSAAANGVLPVLSRIFRSMPGWHNRMPIISSCWFSIATCSGVLRSQSTAFTFAPWSMSVCSTFRRPHWLQIVALLRVDDIRASPALEQTTGQLERGYVDCSNYAIAGLCVTS